MDKGDDQPIIVGFSNNLNELPDKSRQSQNNQSIECQLNQDSSASIEQSLEEEFKGAFKAPFVKGSPVQMSMKFI